MVHNNILQFSGMATQCEPDKSIAIALLGDIGGTNVRLRLVNMGSPKDSLSEIQSIRLKTLEIQSAAPGDPIRSSLLPAIKSFVGSYIDVLKFCILSVCGPVVDGHVTCLAPTMGLEGWLFSEECIAVGLSMPKSSVRLVNDFIAVGLSLPHLPRSAITTMYYPPHISVSSKTANIACIGPGTGLGAVQLVWDYKLDGFVGHGSEAGMASFCPRTEIQWELLQWVRQQPNQDFHVTTETLVSGTGVVNIFKFLCHKRLGDARNSDELFRLACVENRAELVFDNMKSNPICEESVEMFLELLGSEAGDTAMKFRPLGGLYIAGGFLSRIVDEQMMGKIVSAFLNKGKARACCDDIPLYLALPDGDELAIYGLWQYLQSLDNSV